MANVTINQSANPDGASGSNAKSDGKITLLCLTASLALLVFVYHRAFVDAWKLWMTQDDAAHCLFIVPISLALCWLMRDRIRAAERRPRWSGLLLIAIGLVIELLAMFVHANWIPLLTLVPVCAGLVLALSGPDLWRVVRFPILFLVFLSPPPQSLVGPLASQVQRLSTSGAVAILNLVGIPVVQNGFFIDTPSISVEVTHACSGYNKLLSLVAFSVLYGYLYLLPAARRVALTAAVIPVALFANILRIFALVAVGAAWGTHALHAAHDPAEIAVVLVSFGLLSVIGKAIGCKQLRYDRT